MSFVNPKAGIRDENSARETGELIEILKSASIDYRLPIRLRG